MGQQTKMMNAQTHVSAIVGELGGVESDGGRGGAGVEWVSVGQAD